MKLFLVGGSVRDHVLGRQAKDYDFAVEAPSFDDMQRDLKGMGLVTWQSRPAFVTLRGALPYGSLAGSFNFEPNPSRDAELVPADFTLCRTETMYSDMRHPDTVTPSDILTDLTRRDFTMNAMAMTEAGTIIDPHEGARSISDMILRCVGDPAKRFTEDPLRMLRALRFMVTLDMAVGANVYDALCDPNLTQNLSSLPVERVREELNRALVHDWFRTMQSLTYHYANMGSVLRRDFEPLWFRATTEER